MKKKLIILIVLIVAIVAVALFFRESSGATQLVWDFSQGGKLLFPLVTIAALIDSINPCAFSVLLLTIAFLFSLGQLRKGILKIGGSYIAGLFVVYILIGLGILQALHLFSTPHFMAKLGAVLLIALGVINLINEFFPSFPIKLKIPGVAHHKMATLMERGSVPTAFVLGALVALCEFPCTGGPYLMVLGLLHDQGQYVRGLGYLIWYNMVFVLPLVVILLLASNRLVMEKVKIWKKDNVRGMRLYGGVAMVLLGLVILLL